MRFRDVVIVRCGTGQPGLVGCFTSASLDGKTGLLRPQIDDLAVVVPMMIICSRTDVVRHAERLERMTETTIECSMPDIYVSLSRQMVAEKWEDGGALTSTRIRCDG
jgi:hypothetical protein